MTGSPLLRLALIVGALVLLALPLWRITARSTAEPVEAPLPNSGTAVAADPAKSTEASLQFTTISPPARVQISANGETLADLTPSAPTFTTTVSLPHSLKTATDLVITADWPPNAAAPSNALRIRVAGTATSPPVDVTFWGSPNVADVLTLRPPNP